MLRKSDLGFFELKTKPTQRELQEYYDDKYFGTAGKETIYSHRYTDDELEHKKLDLEEALSYAPKGGRTYFEVGCGEGFFLKGFLDAGWDIKGIDFTEEGLNAYFPDLREKVETGDLYEKLEGEVGNGNTYDYVVCNSVVEHVLDPVRLIRLLCKITRAGGVCRIVLSNDGSWLQRDIVRRGQAKNEFWVFAPDRISYFDFESFRKVLRKCKWKIIDLLGGFPIELFLLNPDSNYVLDKGKGRNCHFARVAFDIGMRRHSLDAVMAFRRGCAEAGVGRAIYVYLTPDGSPAKRG